MTTIEIRGKQITLVIAALSVLPALSALFNLLFFGVRRPASSWVGDVVFLLMVSWPLFRGTRSVRIFASVVYGLGAVSTAFWLLVTWPTLGPRQLAVLCLIGAVCLAASLVLWRSAAVRAYFNRPDRRATSTLSGTDGA
jgi:hypothetical protein